MFRSNFLRALVAALTFLSVFGLQLANGAVVRRAQLPELVSLSQIVVHGVVSQTYTGAQKGFFTGIELEVLTALKGLAQDAEVLSIQLPGGENGQHRQIISGLPYLVPGDEVVLLLERTAPGHHVFTGLGQGVYFVLRGDKRTLAVRDLGALMLVEANGQHTHGEDALDAVIELSELLKRIRELVGLRP